MTAGEGHPVIRRELSTTLSYAEAIARLERSLTFGIHPSLDGIRVLTASLGRPQDAFRSIQVTGTNGKTSVVRMISAFLTEHAMRTGSYTSPHLVSYTERVEVDGIAVSEVAFARALEVVFTAAGKAEFTEFELLTAAALWLLRERGVSWACLEVGMGGRWDATSIVSPAVSVVTGISLDHTDRLGTTREHIARDKAHIIKPGSTAVLGPGCAGVEEVLFRRTRTVGAPVVRVGQGEDDVTWRVVEHPSCPGAVLHLAVDGVFGRYRNLELRAPSYQAANVATAIAAAEAAYGRKLDDEALRRALKSLTLPGRFELLADNPPLLVDGAHNPEAAGVLADAIAEVFGDNLPVIVVGILADKDIEGIISALATSAASFIVSENDSPRCAPAGDVARIVECVTGEHPREMPSLSAAIDCARTAGTGIVVTGSLYTVGLARSFLM